MCINVSADEEMDHLRDKFHADHPQHAKKSKHHSKHFSPSNKKKAGVC